MSRSSSSPASAFVSRFEVGQISSTIPRAASSRISSGVAGGEDPVADPVGPERLDDLGDLLDALVAALLADVDRHAEPGRARLLDERRQVAVGVALAAAAAGRRCRRRRSRATPSGSPSRR